MSELFDRLNASLGNFDFVSCLRAIECEQRDKPRVGYAARPSDESVRLSQRPSTGFKGQMLESIEEHTGTHDYRLFCNFFGLLGTNGPMPLHLAEYADRRSRHHQDNTFSEFVDLFNHRLLNYFYRATADLDPAINLDRPDNDGMADMLAAIGGILPEAARCRDSIPDYTKLYMAGNLGRYTKSPDGLSALVNQYFELRVHVEEFTGDWLNLPENAHTRLGRSQQTTTLGVSTYLGRRAWSIGHKFTLVLGPLSWSDYLSFEPGGKRAKELHQLIKNYMGGEWEWDVKLLIANKNIKRSRLDGKAALGFSGFLGAKKSALGSLHHTRLCLSKAGTGIAA